MEGMDAAGRKKSPPRRRIPRGPIDSRHGLEQLLREAAEVEVELEPGGRDDQGRPALLGHRGRAHELGKQLSREVQQRQMSELAASQAHDGQVPGVRHAVPLGIRGNGR